VGSIMEVVKKLLVKKFEEIHRRILLALNQLSDEEVNWRPNQSSNSISNLIVHIDGNVNERIGKGINNRNNIRDRDKEFEEIHKTKEELVDLTNRAFNELIETTKKTNDEILMETQMVRNTKRTNLDMLIQCATHFSEHMGQILYIAKMMKDSEYIITSIPRK
jgi:uncharacterized damage-inducible protein DinB